LQHIWKTLNKNTLQFEERSHWSLERRKLKGFNHFPFISLFFYTQFCLVYLSFCLLYAILVGTFKCFICHRSSYVDLFEANLKLFQFLFLQASLNYISLPSNTKKLHHHVLILYDCDPFEDCCYLGISFWWKVILYVLSCSWRKRK